MKKAILIFILINTLIGKSQMITGVETLIQNESYVVHSNIYNGSTLVNTSNIYLIKGVSDTVWIFGMGYGDPKDIRFYRSNVNINTSLPQKDIFQVDSIIKNVFNITIPAVQFIVPHGHLDHVNQEFITTLQNTFNYNLTNTKLYIHANELYLTTCNSPCCNTSNCTLGNTYYGAPYDTSWTANTLAKFISIGNSTDTCNTLLKRITTNYGYWNVLKADVQHTQGSINLENVQFKIKILGSETGSECNTPADYQILNIHGNLNLSNVIHLNVLDKKKVDSYVKLYPVPSHNNLSIELNNNDHQSLNIQVYDNIGEKVYDLLMQSNNVNVDVEKIKGVGFIIIKSDSGIILSISKFINI